LENLLIVIAGLDPAIHRVLEEGWMPGSSPRLSGLVFVDKVHDVDSSASQAFGDVLGHERDQRHAPQE
jgi:hypothetical protein